MQGPTLHSTQLLFDPGKICSGNYRFEVSTAGSAMLVFQTVAPILSMAQGESDLELTGGTHNPWAPPYDFIRESFLPLLASIGLKIELTLNRHGFYPVGRGKVTGTIHPFGKESRFIDFLHRGDPGPVSAEVLISKLPRSIAERELSTIQQILGKILNESTITEIKEPSGPGNVVVLRVTYGNITHVFTSFGMKGKKAENVAMEVCHDLRQFQASGAALDEHLANQIILYLVLRAGGMLSVPTISRHTATNLEVIKLFSNKSVSVKQVDEKTVIIEIR
jgi:RNA 3'-terminal phosphate cyclase (ATP)